jgi:glycosyltransferase involved in cell wall biosynthesis
VGGTEVACNRICKHSPRGILHGNNERRAITAVAPNISIAMTTYNGERHVGKQLDSLSGQSRLPDEVVVCDDCSRDGTVKILEEFAATAPFVMRIVANEKNVGYVENFSKALELCTGDIIFLCDQDDVWLPNKLVAMEEYFERHPLVQLAIHDIAFCKGDLTEIGQTKIQRMEGVFDLYDAYVVGMASAARAAFLRRCLPIPSSAGLTHDRWLHLCANTLGRKGLVREVLALHRRHGGNVTFDNPLNVDFVTPLNHFKRSRPNLVERLARMRDANVLRWSESAALLDWLTCWRDELVEAGCAERTYIDGCIARERRHNEAEVLRGRIWADQGRSCIAAIVKLYRSGGYLFFRGWKSLIGDLLFRCLMRF